MVARSSPTAKRRRIARELRRLRAESGQTVAAVGTAVGMSPSAVSRIEKAEVSAHPTHVGALLRHYGVAEEDVLTLIELAKQAKKRGWWHRYGSAVPDWFQVYIGLESDAMRIRKYEPQLVPGQLQTADYARAVIRAEHPNADAAEITRRTDLRMERQSRENPLALWVVVDEAMLHRVVGTPKIMRDQLERLIEAAEQPGNDIQVLPFSAGEHGSMGVAFSILTFPDPRDPSVVYLENHADSLYLEEADEVESYETLFDHLRAAAAGVRPTVDILQQTIHNL